MAGEAIISVGEPGDAIYFVERGGAEVEVGGATVMSYSRGDYFGELALLTDEPRRATVRAGAAGIQVLKLNREAFDETLQERLRGKNEGEAVEEYRCLSIAPLLHSLAPEVRARIAEAMEMIEIEANCAIITVGEPGDAIYFLEHGSAQAEVDGAVVRSYKQGSHFGELALLTSDPRKATVRAGATGAQVLKLGRLDFEQNLVSKFRDWTYRSLHGSTIRAGFDAKSADMGSIETGGVFDVVEEHLGVEGETSARLASGGWVTIMSSSGKQLCATEVDIQLQRWL
eukprot:COSAG06_NODE_13397_length_1261_cov_1.277969_2_plen_284_part_01